MLYILKILKVIVHIALLYGMLLIGNWIQEFFGLSIPGSVIGMLLLFVLLKFNIIKFSWIKEGTQFILNHLTLFFIPVTIGFINYLELFSGRGILLLLSVVVSTALVMGGSGAISQWLANRKDTQYE